jgi:hypothetical protein
MNYEGDEYWLEREQVKCFSIFLLCIKKQPQIPILPRDIKQLLFIHLNKYIQFRGLGNPQTKIPTFTSVIDLVGDLEIVLPPGSTICKSAFIKHFPIIEIVI